MGSGGKDGHPSKLDLLVRMSRLLITVSALLAQAEAAERSGDLASAIVLYEKQLAAGDEHLVLALLHNKHFDDPVTIQTIVQPQVNALMTLADLLEAQGRLAEAERRRQKAAELARAHLGRTAEAENERSRAASLVGQGRFNEALVALTASREFFQARGDALTMARVSVDMADILQWLGDFPRALAGLEHAAVLIAPLHTGRKAERTNPSQALLDELRASTFGAGDARQPDKTVALYRILVEINYFRGLTCKALGRFAEAEALFRAVLPEYAKLGVGAAIEFQLAAVLIGRGEYERGLELAGRLEPVFRRAGVFRHKLAALLKIQAEALLAQGDRATALEKAREGVRDLAVYHDPDLAWKLQRLEGRLLEDLGRGKEALDAYGKALETVGFLRRAPLGYRLDNTYLKDKLPLFQEAIALAVERSDPARCCRFLEMIKARGLSVVLSLGRRRRGEQTHPDATRRQFEEVTEKIEAFEYQAYRDGETEELRNAKAKLLEERTSLLERIRFSDPRWRALTEPLSFSFEATMETLRRRGQAALNLFGECERITAVLMTGDVCRAESRELRGETRKKLEAYKRNLQSPAPDRLRYDLSAALDVQAADLVPESLLEKSLAAESLVIVPHGILHLVPWAGLLYEGKRLFEYCPVSILPNLTCFTGLEGDFSRRPVVALIGAPSYPGLSNLKPLPRATEELLAIEGLYADENRVIAAAALDFQATEKAFWDLALKKDAAGAILHAACHAVIEPYEPMNSGLLFNDSKVDAAEIAQSFIRYEEVVLSACSTGWRPMEVEDIELVGDDILGLPGAFLEAGARSVLTSITPADDAAACMFMTNYHRRRFDGMSPLPALQQTQKQMLGDSAFAPHAWVGFTVYGCR